MCHGQQPALRTQPVPTAAHPMWDENQQAADRLSNKRTAATSQAASETAADNPQMQQSACVIQAAARHPAMQATNLAMVPANSHRL